VLRSIRRLEPETASRIAAGEVIERPLSALKEVLENSLDAGARSIEIRVEKALDHAFQVADDGEGIAAGEIELALERHATSKIGSLDDLERLASLGFRGEALPSIAAVSRFVITSRTRSSDSAVTVAGEGGAIRERRDAARAPGTTVEIAELFYNTPARRKFLSSSTGEMRAAVRMIECYALGFPEVAFRLVVDGRERFHWPAIAGARTGQNGTTIDAPLLDARRARAGAVWGPAHSAQLLDADGEREGMRVAALLGLPEHARASREGQIFLVNRRWIQSPLLGQALRQAYGNLLPNGRFPASTLWLTIPASRLDVNVHPTKREVRFADDDALFGLVAGACAKRLAHLHPPFTVVPGGRASEPSWEERVRERPTNQTYLGLETPGVASGGTAEIAARDPSEGAPLAASASAAGARAPDPEFWQLHRTYVFAPVRNGVVIIDQHAAHERILYEETRRRLTGERGSSQQLLFPALVDLTHSQFEMLLEIQPWLERLGWNVAPLGPPTVVIQGVPSDLKHDQPSQFLLDLLDGVSESSGRHASEDLMEHVARTHACHAAIRAGDALGQEEMKALVDRLFATSRPHGDPHGRATFVRLDLDELHRRFGRA
jgi:DNA mismatch repair protein MutL